MLIDVVYELLILFRSPCTFLQHGHGTLFWTIWWATHIWNLWLIWLEGRKKGRWNFFWYVSVTLVFISNLRINPIYVYKCSVFSVPCIFCSVSVSALHTRSCVTDFQRSFSEECFSLPFPPLSLSLSLFSLFSLFWFVLCFWESIIKFLP